MKPLHSVPYSRCAAIHQLLPGLALSLGLLTAPAGEAAVALDALRLTPDVTLVLGSGDTTVTPQDVARHVPGGAATLETGSPFVAAGVQISGYHYLDADRQWFSFDTTVVLDAVTVTPQDIAERNGGSWSLLLDGSAEGIPTGVRIDALARDPETGDLLLSFDTTVSLDGTTFDPRDIARYAAGSFSMYSALSALVPNGLDLTGLDVLPGGRLLVSFDGSGLLGGVAFDDEDVLEHDPVSGTWEMSYDGSADDPDWAPAQLAAFAAEPTPGILVSPTAGLVTTEAGGSAEFQVVLLSAPGAAVTIPLSTSDPTEGTPSTSTVTFGPANWSIAQTVTVTGANDFVVDGAQPYTIATATAVSTDADYNGLDPADVALINLDDDGPGISVLPTTGLITTEGGGTDGFVVVLNTQPSADVSIAISSSDATEGDVAPATLTFTPDNWAQPQAVTVTGLDDPNVDGNIVYAIVTAPAVSGDPTYDGLDPADVTALNLDDDAPGISVFPLAGLVTTEAGGTASFRVVLNTPPTADVTVPLSVSDSSEGMLAVASLTFTPADWDMPQTVIVTGVDDIFPDGDRPYFVITGPAVSGDPDYDQRNAADVSLTNLDYPRIPGFPGFPPGTPGTPHPTSLEPVPTLTPLGIGLLGLLLAGIAYRSRRKR